MASSYPVELRWFTAEEGGRKDPIRGGRYTPTARFALEQEHFGVILEYPASIKGNPTKATLRLLNPDLVEIQQRFHPGVALEVMEGTRVVARCVIEKADVGASAAGGSKVA